MTSNEPELREWARRLVADWPPLTPEQADLLRRTYGRVQPGDASADQEEGE